MSQRKGQYFLLTDDMDDIGLIGNMETEQPSTSRTSNNHNSPGADAALPAKSDAKNVPRVARTPSDTQNFIMMYSNDTEEVSAQMGLNRQTSSSTSYANMEAEENIKCIVTTVLIIAIITALLVVTFIVNPQM